MTIPEVIIIVPYRDRKTQKFFFSKHMEYVLETYNYEIYFVHQSDKRPFNRGAIKNIGFLAIKHKYPDHYQTMTFVFHDIDTLPFDKILDYKTMPGIVKHFYGFEHSLGGIFSITGDDFELSLGFPTLWGWGEEDTIIYNRCLTAGLAINREQFYSIGSPEILHLFDGIQRIINPGETEGIGKNIDNLNMTTISNLKYTIDTQSTNMLDNIFVVDNNKIMYINVSGFNTINRILDNFYSYDIRHPIDNIIKPNSSRKQHPSNLYHKWTDIPYYPTKNEKTELIRAYGKDNTQKILNYNEHYSHSPKQILIPPELQKPTPNVSIFSPNYAALHGIKPRATTSANIGMGGIIKSKR